MVPNNVAGRIDLLKALVGVEKGAPLRRVLPLLHSDLERAFQKPATLLSTIRDRVLLLVGFAGALRRSELVGIDVERVRFCEGGLMLTIPRSKTDPYKIGRSIFIAARPSNGCAVSALQGLFSGGSLQSGAVFRSVNSRGQFGDRLSTEYVSVAVKVVAKALGRDPRRYSGHSLRAGFVTDAAVTGLPVWKIQRQMGHSSLGMLCRYIREA